MLCRRLAVLLAFQAAGSRAAVSTTCGGSFSFAITGHHQKEVEPIIDKTPAATSMGAIPIVSAMAIEINGEINAPMFIMVT
jgi:hypothetical protein